MSKFLSFFKYRPLLALFLVTVVTICCVNLAITVQSDHYKKVSSFIDESEDWILSESPARQETAQSESVLISSNVKGTSFDEEPTPVVLKSEETISPSGSFDSADRFYLEETDSIEITADNADESADWSMMALDSETLEPVSESASLSEENEEPITGDSFFADEKDEDTFSADNSDLSAETDFFASDNETEITSNEQTWNLSRTADEESESEPETSEEEEKEVSSYAAQEPNDLVADYFSQEDEAAAETRSSADAENGSSLTWTVPSDIPVSTAAVENADSETPAEKKELSEDEFFAVAESILDGELKDQTVPAETASLEQETAGNSEPAVTEQTEVASAEPAETEAAAANDGEPASAAEEETVVSTDPAPAAEEVAVSTEPVPAAEEVAVSTEPAPAVEEAAVSTEPAPAAEEAVASTVPAPAADEAVALSTEPIIADDSLTGEGTVSRPIPDYQSVSQLRPSEVWAVSTESLTAISADPNQLTCWKSEDGKFRPATLDEYKEGIVPQMPTIILIHGNMTDWSGALQHAQTLKYRIDQLRINQNIQLPYRLVIWKWRSERQNQMIRPDSQLKAYLADLNGYYLASFLCKTGGAQSDITLIGFSFGARTIGSALELMSGGSVLGHVFPANTQIPNDRYHAILLAGACNYGDFGTGGQYVHGSALLSSMINVFNPTDKALHFYPFLFGAGGPDAIGVAPVNPAAVPESFRNRLWSIDSSIYGSQHNFDNLLYSISDPLLESLVFAAGNGNAAQDIPTVTKAEADPSFVAAAVEVITTD